VTTAPPVSIDRATRADLLSVYRIECASFTEPWPYAAFERFLSEPGFLVAREGEAIVGYVIADSVPNHGRPIGHVKDIAVHPEHRGRGVGRDLLARALGALAAAGCARVKLEVRAGNASARSLYRRFGFEAQRQVPGYYQDGETAIVMVCALGR
jgi:[ribosomal protein S18]-alanine N-acetyltransferase